MIYLINCEDTFFGFKKAKELSGEDYLNFSFNNIQALLEYFSNNFLFSKPKNIIISEFPNDSKYYLSKEVKRIIEHIGSFDGKIVLLNTDLNIKIKSKLNLEIDNEINIAKINGQNFRSIIEKEIKNKDLVIGTKEVDYLTTILKHDYNVVISEIEKLSLLGKPKVTLKDIEKVCSYSNNQSIFKIVEHYLLNKNKLAFELMKNFIDEGNSVEQLFSMIVTQLFKIKMYVIHYCNFKSIDKLVKDFNLKFFQVNSIKNFIIKAKLEKIEYIFDALYKIDYDVKKNGLNRYDLLTLFLLKKFSD